VVALVGLLGLAVLDLGPRAVASFIPAISPLNRSDAGLGGASSSASADLQERPRVSPPCPDPDTTIQWAHHGPDGSSGTSTGSPSGPSSNAGHSSPLLAGGADVPPPALITRLRAPAPLIHSQRFSSALFEPPRASA
jgi:hypothetical protein